MIAFFELVYEVADADGQPLEDRVVELNGQQQTGLGVRRDLIHKPLPAIAIEREMLAQLQQACWQYGPL